MDWLAGICADLREAVAHLRHVHNDVLYKSTVILLNSTLPEQSAVLDFHVAPAGTSSHLEPTLSLSPRAGMPADNITGTAH